MKNIALISAAGYLMTTQALPVVDLKALKFNDFELEHNCLVGE